MDMPEIATLFTTLARVLKSGGIFVFSLTHPCFHSAMIQRFAEMYEEEAGRFITRTGIKVSSYITPFSKKTEGIVGQPEPHWYFHRPISTLFRLGFDNGFMIDGLEEPNLPTSEPTRAGTSWADMTEIPPVLVVRMRLLIKQE